MWKIPKPTYKSIQIFLPPQPGVPNLPRFIFFDLDTRLNEARVRTAIVALLAFWEQHYEETAADGTSELARCARTYAKQNLTPVWIDEEREKLITNGEEALEFAMDTLTSFFRQNGFMQVPFAKIDYAETPSIAIAFSENGNYEFGVPLDVTFNNQQLIEQDVITIVGSLFHAWMHRLGYRHPPYIYTNNLSGETPMCLMRGNQPKTPGQPDSVFTRFFD